MSKRKPNAEVELTPVCRISKIQVVASRKPCLKTTQCLTTQPTEPVAFLPRTDLRKPWNSKQGAEHRRHVLQRLAKDVKSLDRKAGMSPAKEISGTVSFLDQPVIYEFERAREEVLAMFGPKNDSNRCGIPPSHWADTRKPGKEVDTIDEPTIKGRLRNTKTKPYVAEP